MSRKPPATRTAGPVGRDDVLAELRRVVDETAAGRGHLLLLAGEAGIGKTTMLTAAAGYAESRGARVAWGWGWPGEGAPGYWPWVQVMRMLDLDIPWPGQGTEASAAGDAPASERFRLFDEVTSLLLAESRIQPLLLLLDDLQWADQPSHLLLDFLARRLPAGAVAVVGSYRDTEPTPGPPPGPALAALAARTTVLPLTGLGPDAVGDLVADVVGERRAAEVAAGVHRRTGGNPFFVQQVSWLLHSGQDGIPPGVHEALELRFAALPGAAAATLRTAAVIGQRFSADLAARAAGQPAGAVAEALDAAARARVVSRDGQDAYRFAHDLFREYAYDQLPAAERARLHLRIGQALEARRAEGGALSDQQGPLAELARHFVLADPASAQAWEYSVAAAREATARLAYEEAVRHWEHAVAAADAGPAGRIEVLLELAEARRRSGQGQAAGQAYLRAAELARAGRDPAGLARAALGLHAIGTRTWWPPDQVVALLSEALDALGSGSGREPLRLHVMASLARALAWHGLDLSRARALAGQAVAAARAAGDPLTLASCLLAQHHAIWAAGTARDRLRIAAEVAGLAERSGDHEILLEARLLAATDRLELADPGFRAELDEFIRLAEASRQPRFRYAALVRRGTLALLAGRLAEAERLVGQAEMLGEECGEPGVRDVRYDQGWDLLTAQGRLGELGGALPEMFPDPDSAQARGARALVMLASGARAEAAEAVAPLLKAGPGTIPPGRQRLLSLIFAAEISVAFGAVPAAERLYAALLPFQDETVVSGAAITFKGAVAHYLGLLAAVLGQAATAASHLERAVAAHDRLDAAAWSLRSRYQLATVWLGEPERRAAAVAVLAEVAAAARKLGLAQLARDAEAAGFAAGQVPVSEGVFTRDGAMWTLAYGGVTVRMRDAKGLSDLAVLLAVPGRQVPAADLIAAAGAGQAGLADLRLGADEVLDATARRQIRVRLASLGEDIAEAESWNDPERAARARLARWGVLDAVLEAGTPVTRDVRFDQGDAVITGRYPGYQGVEAMCSPRRTLLDRVLVDAARAAGAEVRENFAVEEILGDGQVTGIRGREKGAPEVTEQARLVIGADGKHSLVATAVGARAYRTRPPRSIAFYTYWADVPARDGSPAGTGEIYGRPGCAVGAWPTNDGLLMTYLAWPAARFDEFRRDVEGNFLRTLDAVGLGERIRAGRRAERFRGTPDLPSYLRQPYGPGWALVGDAGLLLDPITGQGISHAFRDAELLADAVADGLGGIRPLAEALRQYHRARDRASRPMYDFTARLAAVSPPTPAEIALFQALARRQQDADMFVGALAGSVPLRQFMSPRTMVRLVGVGGFARLMLAQARSHRAGAAADPHVTDGSSARSAENASAT